MRYNSFLFFENIPKFYIYAEKKKTNYQNCDTKLHPFHNSFKSFKRDNGILVEHGQILNSKKSADKCSLLSMKIERERERER